MVTWKRLKRQEEKIFQEIVHFKKEHEWKNKEGNQDPLYCADFPYSTVSFKLCIEFECDLLLQSSMENMTVVHKINRWFLEFLESKISNKWTCKSLLSINQKSIVLCELTYFGTLLFFLSFMEKFSQELVHMKSW